jgi:hypothetical protein
MIEEESESYSSSDPPGASSCFGWLFFFVRFRGGEGESGEGGGARFLTDFLIGWLDGLSWLSSREAVLVEGGLLVDSAVPVA